MPEVHLFKVEKNNLTLIDNLNYFKKNGDAEIAVKCYVFTGVLSLTLRKTTDNKILP